MEFLETKFNEINNRLNQMERDIKKLKKIQSNRMTIKQSKSSRIKMNKSAPERINIDDDAERRAKQKQILEQALAELGDKEALEDNPRIREGREDKSSSS